MVLSQRKLGFSSPWGSLLRDISDHSVTKVYFFHPYASYERGTNERHNCLIRRFFPKGKRVGDYDLDDIAYIEEWMNSLPRKSLGHSTPERLFEKERDRIDAT